tara:strand:- start:165 stop:395 length:231 start_codon:yes stop_codon:yes gene_type:complete
MLFDLASHGNFHSFGQLINRVIIVVNMALNLESFFHLFGGLFGFIFLTLHLDFHFDFKKISNNVFTLISILEWASE